MVSECCGATEWIEGSNRCGDCKEWCEFVNEEQRLVWNGIQRQI